MNILIIFAHPEPKSLNGKLKDTAVQYLSEQGHEVQVSDLFAQNFKTQADRADFPSYSEDFFDLQLAQQRSHNTQTVPKDIQKEQDKLRWAELIIFQFPLWWYSFPAPMKGYVDRVFSVGFAYGGRSELMDKKVLLSIITGAPEQAWTPERNNRTSILPHYSRYFQALRFTIFRTFCGLWCKAKIRCRACQCFRRF